MNTFKLYSSKQLVKLEVKNNIIISTKFLIGKKKLFSSLPGILGSFLTSLIGRVICFDFY